MIPNMIPKSHTFKGRFIEVQADPSNSLINRHPEAGTIKDGKIVVHNGLLISNDYYGEFIEIMKINRGVHEPQEEYVFQEVLKHIKPSSTMIELGSYWAFFSMWFNQKIKNAKNYMVEPNSKNLLCGINNFALNNMVGNFTQNHIGQYGLCLTEFMELHSIKTIDLLHLDIQGFELVLLEDSIELFNNKLISYCFISTHSQHLHLECVKFANKVGYETIASADFDNQTFCYDGVLVIKNPNIALPKPIKLSERYLTNYLKNYTIKKFNIF